MALRPTFRAPSVFDFPMAAKGAQPWPVQFPVENDAPGYVWSWWKALCVSLLFAWLGAIPGSLSMVETSHSDLALIIDDRERTVRTFARPIVYAAMLGGCFQLTKLSLLGDRSRTIRCGIALSLWLLCLSAIVFSLSLPLFSTALAMLFLTVNAARFKKHYAYVTSGGLLDPINRELFRRTGKVRCAVPQCSRVEGLADAVNSWLTYNRNEERLPGLIISPVGTKFCRAAESCLAILLLGNAVSFGIAKAFQPFERLLLATFHLPPYQTGGLILAVYFLLAPMVVVLYLAAIALASFDVLPIGLGLKKSAYSPERWERFLDSLEFTENVAG